MDSTLKIPKMPIEREGCLWPSKEYDEQVNYLKQSIGQDIYLLEVNYSDIYITLSQIGRAHNLLDVIDFPSPDPEKYLYPHMIITDDGRGLNLGRVARITVNHAFMPEEEDIIYREHFMLKQLAYCERRLSNKSIQRASKVQLAKILGISMRGAEEFRIKDE
ncbi:MAG: hypothetical protein OQK73_00440 [Gammaproteobacteria bacterium]|nr:hypothetical protein [Gammaproteobacteria bacterium]